MAHKQIYYSDKYDDDKYEYRLVKAHKNAIVSLPEYLPIHYCD